MVLCSLCYLDRVCVVHQRDFASVAKVNMNTNEPPLAFIHLNIILAMRPCSRLLLGAGDY
jgi:hypothetical protein